MSKAHKSIGHDAAAQLVTDPSPGRLYDKRKAPLHVFLSPSSISHLITPHPIPSHPDVFHRIASHRIASHSTSPNLIPLYCIPSHSIRPIPTHSSLPSFLLYFPLLSLFTSLLPRSIDVRGLLCTLLFADMPAPSLADAPRFALPEAGDARALTPLRSPPLAAAGLAEYSSLGLTLVAVRVSRPETAIGCASLCCAVGM